MQRMRKILLVTILVAKLFLLTGCFKDCIGEGCWGCDEGYEQICHTVRDLDTGEVKDFCRCLWVGEAE